MFCDGGDRAFRILGVYRVKSNAESMSEKKRLHTAISIRIKGKSVFYYGENGNIKKEASDGTVVYLPAGLDYHRITGAKEERIVVHLDETASENGREIEVFSGCEALIPIFESLLITWETGERSSYNRAMQTLYKIFEALQSLRGDNTAVPRSIIAGVRLMESGFRDPELRISACARECHVSETYFRRVYTARFGVSPMKALEELRFSYALRLIETGYYKIKEVAYLSGFSDPKYFRAAFKKRYGIPPKLFARD